jgi:hypothetical protein
LPRTQDLDEEIAETARQIEAAKLARATYQHAKRQLVRCVGALAVLDHARAVRGVAFKPAHTIQRLTLVRCQPQSLVRARVCVCTAAAQHTKRRWSVWADAGRWCIAGRHGRAVPLLGRLGDGDLPAGAGCAQARAARGAGRDVLAAGREVSVTSTAPPISWVMPAPPRPTPCLTVENVRASHRHAYRVAKRRLLYCTGALEYIEFLQHLTLLEVRSATKMVEGGIKADMDDAQKVLGADAVAEHAVREPFPSFAWPVLAEMHLCYSCSCPQILRAETARQGLKMAVRKATVAQGTLDFLRGVVLGGLGGFAPEVRSAAQAKAQQRRHEAGAWPRPAGQSFRAPTSVGHAARIVDVEWPFSLGSVCACHAIESS